jgi:hypothetical protein
MSQWECGFRYASGLGSSWALQRPHDKITEPLCADAHAPASCGFPTGLPDRCEFDCGSVEIKFKAGSCRRTCSASTGLFNEHKVGWGKFGFCVQRGKNKGVLVPYSYSALQRFLSFLASAPTLPIDLNSHAARSWQNFRVRNKVTSQWMKIREKLSLWWPCSDSVGPSSCFLASQCAKSDGRSSTWVTTSLW